MLIRLLLIIAAASLFSPDSLNAGLAVRFGINTRSVATSETYKPQLVKVNTKKEDIKPIQRALKSLGYYSGSVDGVFGPGSRNAAARLLKSANIRGGFTKENIEALLLLCMMVDGKGMSESEAIQRLPDARQFLAKFWDFSAAMEREDYEVALPLGQESSLRAEELFGASSVYTINTKLLTGLASTNLGTLELGEALLGSAYADAITFLGPNNPNTVWAESQLALLELEKKNYVNAERLLRNNVANARRVLGKSDGQYWVSLGNLAAVLGALGLVNESEQVAREVLNGLENPAAPKIKHRERLIASAKSNISHSLAIQDRLSEARSIAAEAVVAQTAYNGPDHKNTIKSKLNLASIDLLLGNLKAAEKIYRAIIDSENDGSKDVYSIDFGAKTGLVRALLGLGRYSEATQALESFDFQVDELQTGQKVSWHALRALAFSYIERRDSAYEEYIEAFSFYAEYQRQQVSSIEAHFLFRREVLFQLFKETSERAPFDRRSLEISLIGQNWWRFGSLDSTLRNLSLRQTGSDEESSELIRRYQKLREELNLLVSLHASSFGSPSKAHLSNVYSKKIDVLSAEIDVITREIERKLPNAAAELRPRSLDVGEAQKLLAEDEAVVAFAVSSDRTFVWKLTSDSIQIRSVPVSADVLEQLTVRVRQGVDFTVSPFEHPPSGSCALHSESELLDGRDFDICAAEDLYRQLLGGFDLSGVAHLYVVPDGPLEPIPFATLVMARNEDNSPVWLVDRMATTTLPSISSLVSLRTRQSQIGRGPKRKPFLGIAPVNFERIAMGGEVEGAPPSLPGTALEVKALAEILDPLGAGVLVGAAATEVAVKSKPLHEYDLVSFATHGLTSDETAYLTRSRIREPSLLLNGTGVDGDGVLTASEISTLRLDADWVLLSGCNTASGESNRSGGLSGLARAFFFAGARSLLVTHWSIEDQSAKALMEETIRFSKAHPELGKAVAVRHASLSVQHTRGYEHPFFWAPFVLVGDGSAEQVNGPASYASLNDSGRIDPIASLAGVEIAALSDPQSSQPAFPLRGVVSTKAVSTIEVEMPEGTRESEKELNLDRQQRMEIQKRLTLIGFDTKGIDGALGPASRRAISGWQSSLGIPETGYLNESQLEKLNHESEPAYAAWIEGGNKLPNPVRIRSKKKRKCVNLGIARVCSTR